MINDFYIIQLFGDLFAKILKLILYIYKIFNFNSLSLPYKTLHRHPILNPILINFTLLFIITLTLLC
jgi:hypothetical protein